MRTTIIAAAAFGALLAGSLPASAQQEGRYCAEMKNGTSSAGKPSCLYRTMEQCQEAVKGNQGICVEKQPVAASAKRVPRPCSFGESCA